MIYCHDVGVMKSIHRNSYQIHKPTTGVIDAGFSFMYEGLDSRFIGGSHQIDCYGSSLDFQGIRPLKMKFNYRAKDIPIHPSIITGEPYVKRCA